MTNRMMIGVCAMRDPKTGAFLDARPIFKEETQDDAKAREAMTANAGKLFARLLSEKN